MGFWGSLGKGLLGAGGVIAAPFTGGASLATVIPAILGGAGAVASAASAGRANGRAAEAGINNNQDALKLRAAQLLEDALQNRGGLDLRQKQFAEDAMQGRAGLDLRQRAFALSAPQQRASNAVRGDALAGLQDANVSGPIVHTHGQVPQITGGMRPSLLSGNTRALGSQMSRDAMLGQMKGDTFDTPPALPSFAPMPAPQIPGVTPTPQAGKTDSVLNWLGGIGAGVGAVSPLLPKRNPYQVPPIPQQYGDWQDEGIG